MEEEVKFFVCFLSELVAKTWRSCRYHTVYICLFLTYFKAVSGIYLPHNFKIYLPFRIDAVDGVELRLMERKSKFLVPSSLGAGG